MLCTELGVEALEVYEVWITDWADSPLTERQAPGGRTVWAGGLCYALGELERALASGEPLPWDAIAIDTIDNAFQMCSEWIAAQSDIKVKTIGDIPYGKGYEQLETEFRRVLTKLSRLPLGVWLTSHSQVSNVRTLDGLEYQMHTSTIPKRGRPIVHGMCDAILFADREITEPRKGQVEERRVIRTKSSARYEAGDRTGLLPETIDLSYQAFLDAWKAIGGK